MIIECSASKRYFEMMKKFYCIALIPFVLLACTENPEEPSSIEDDFFSTDGSADSARTRRFRLVPEGAPAPLEPNDERLGEQLFYQPHEATVLEDGTIHYAQPEDYWYQVRWYEMTVETRGRLVIDASSENGIIIRVWVNESGGRQEAARNDNYVSIDVVPVGTYTITMEPQVYPFATEQENAFVQYDLTTTFTAE
jgi:hypothetical protein